MAFLPDGTMFFTEKCHGLSVRQSGGTVVKLLGMKDAKGYASSAGDLFCEGQAGMAGVAVAVAVAVDPNFASNRFVYVYSTSSLAAPGSNRVMRLKGNDNATAVSDRTDIVTDIPYKPRASDHPFGGPGAHNGGASPLQPRRRLSLRDHRRHAQRRSASKPDPHRRQGSAHRPQRQGRPGQWRASGLRLSGLHLWASQPQGITFRPGTHQPYTAENGPGHTDEVTALVPGGNAGWDPRPNIGGRGACPDGYCGYSPNQMGAMDPKERGAFMPMTDTKTYPNAMRPAWTNDGLSQGLFTGTFLTGSQWKAWNGRMIIGFTGIGIHGTPVGNRLDVLDIKADGSSATRTTVNLPMPAARFRSLVQGPDGNLYVATDEGAISRLTPN